MCKTFDFKLERCFALSQGDLIETGHLLDDLRDLNIRALRRRDGRVLSLGAVRK
ncbi:MAG: hypothetical protein KJ558_00060 [Gammaproteobacteria bacterium]|nr:hypothetical protein [Gammaproteobacteria bacterium]MBU1653243.1 hypothetical protein [Gammaproteobacteria bacterium]MBU1961047.1 hypothetical protein [Gammaproteobacteria bacterium]